MGLQHCSTNSFCTNMLLRVDTKSSKWNVLHNNNQIGRSAYLLSYSCIDMLFGHLWTASQKLYS